MSLLAALEEDSSHDRHAGVLPFLGMARAELTDFGQRRPARYIPIERCDVRTSGLVELEGQLTGLVARIARAPAQPPRQRPVHRMITIA